MPNDVKPHPDEVELVMLRDLIILPYMLDMVQQANNDAKYSVNFLRDFFVDLNDAVMDCISSDLSEIRRELRKRQIKTWDGERTEFVLYIGYNCRGYQHTFGITVEVAKAEIRVQFRRYINMVARKLRSR